MTERVALRLAALEATRGAPPFDPEAFGMLLESSFGEEIPNLTGDAERDIATISVARENGETGCAFELTGHAASGVCRLWCAFDHAYDDAIAVFIAVTKGEEEASCESFGRSGPDFGNRALVAKALDLTLAAAIPCGLRRIVNDPWDARVRGIYAAMGFTNGESLYLDDPGCLTMALEFIQHAYDAAEVEHAGFTPPW